MIDKSSLFKGYLTTKKETRIKRISLYFFEVGLFLWEFIFPNIIIIFVHNGLSIWNVIVSGISLGLFRMIIYLVDKKYKFQENIKFTIPFLGLGIIFTSSYYLLGKKNSS